MLAEQSFGIAAWRGGQSQMTELRQDQIQDLRGRDFERTLLEEVPQRIGRFVPGDLQDAFVHREQHDARRRLRAITQFQRLSRLHQRRCFDRDGIAARIHIDRERLHAVRERTGVDLRGARIAHERH